MQAPNNSHIAYAALAVRHRNFEMWEVAISEVEMYYQHTGSRDMPPLRKL